MKTTCLILAGGILLAGCAQTTNQPALELAATGLKTTGAISSGLKGVSDDVAAIPERNHVRQTLVQCSAALAEAPSGAKVVCAPAQAPPDDAIQANAKLARVMLRRAELFSALGGAYGALEAEAKYDARGDLEGAIQELGASGDALNAAIIAAGKSGLPGLDLIVNVAAKAGGYFAERAQRKRLFTASQAIRGALIAARQAVKDEASLYAGISTIVDSNKQRVVDQLIVSGLIDPRPPVRDFLGDMSLGLSADVKPDSPRLVAASRAVSSYRGRQAAIARAKVYEKLDDTLASLIRQHEAFEEDQATSRLDVERTLEELRFWGEQLAELQAAAEEGE